MAEYYHGILSTPPDCNNCPLKYDKKVYPDGLVPARVAIVAEAPGPEEVKKGRGLIGASGQLLWMLAAPGGLKREECWVSNSILCKPHDVVLSNGARIPEDLVKAMAGVACRLRLVNELRVVQPKVIVPVGNWSLWALADIPQGKIYDYRGSRIDIDLDALAYKIEHGLCRAPVRQMRGKDQ